MRAAVTAAVIMFLLSVGALRPESAEAHRGQYAFERWDVRAHAMRLRFTFNRAWPMYGPHDVRCRGVGAVRFDDGSRGFWHIRCVVETMAVPDFIYHLDRKGREFVTRAWS